MIHFQMKFQVLPNNPKRKLLTQNDISCVSYKCKRIGQENGAFPTVQGKKEFPNGKNGRMFRFKVDLKK